MKAAKQAKKRSQEHINYFEYALKGVFTYKTRTFAIVCSLVIAVMILASMTFLATGLSSEASTSAAFAPDITVENTMAGRPAAIPLTDIQAISNMTGVARVVPRTWGYVEYSGKIYTVMGIDAENMPIPQDIDFIMSSGQFLSSDQNNSAIVGKNIADSLNLKLGDVLTLETQSGIENYSFTITGIFSTNVNLYTSDLILVNINAAEQFFSENPGCVTDLCVYVTNQNYQPIIPGSLVRENTNAADQVAQEIEAYNPSLRVLTQYNIREDSVSVYGLRSGYVSIAWYVLLLSVILLALNQATAAGADMRKEVGILKALGFSTSNILEIRFLETLILGFVATTTGIFAAIIYDVIFGAPVIGSFLLGWSAVYPGFPLPINVSASNVAILYATAILPLFIGSLIPAWRSAVTEPDIAIRGN
ncbi:MAG TPA: ABC transporter permease [Candidatus Nanoarchaeia archaeon]|nr:ABC transporter permease [Candidatus Nanoarchaeia archaeon]